MKRKESIARVKKKLWRFGYSVKDFSQTDIINFDLLVEGKSKVKIVKEFYTPIDNEQVIVKVDDDKVIFLKRSGQNQVMSKSPYDIFGRKKLIKKQSHETITKRQND